MHKFRGINGAVIGGIEIDTVAVIDYMHDEVYFDHGADVATSIEDAKLMAFTGLTDSTGVEIYEGDIVGFRDGNDEPCVSEVRFSGGALCIDVNHYDYDHTAIGWALDNGDANDVVVIGNIHEHPELLSAEPDQPTKSAT